MKTRAAVLVAAAMASQRELLLFAVVLLGSIRRCQGQEEDVTSALKNIFLSKPFNATEREEILKSGRESFLYLKGLEKPLEASQKSNFAKNYANFLSELLKLLRTKDVGVQEIFSIENSFLKDYKENSTVGEVNVTEVQMSIENFQIAAERLLVPYYNSSSESYDAAEILNLENSRFDAFLKEKLRAEFSEIGYFFLEVFATLIGLSWGLISTVIHVAENQGGS